jgi:lipoate synthase
MSKPRFTLDPSPVLFDLSTRENEQLAARVERVALEHIELAANPRREISDEGIDRLAKMLCACKASPSRSAA